MQGINGSHITNFNFAPDVPKGLSHLKHICFEGIIAAGKSTAAEAIAKQYAGAQFLEEPVNDNPYLPIFYKDLAEGTCCQTRSAAIMQLYLLHRRYENHLKSIFGNRRGLTIEDRSIYGDTVFAHMMYEQGNIAEIDYQTYLQAFEMMRDHLKYPDLVIYLDVSPETAYDRIHNKRKRESESEIPIEYLRDLKHHYEQFIRNIERYCPVLWLDWNDPVALAESEGFSSEAEMLLAHIENIDGNISWPFMHFRKGTGCADYRESKKKD